MYISRIRLENIRGFSGSRDVDLTLTRPDGSHAGWTVLAGRNGSGKTSLLRAIALAASGPLVAPNLMPDLRDWVTAGQQQATIEARLHADVDVDYWPRRGSTQTTDFTVTMQWTIATSPRTSKRDILQPLPSASIPTEFADGLWQANSSGWFCAAYGPFRRMAGGAADAQRLMLAPGPVARQASLFYEDASLTEGVQWLIDQHLRALEKKPGAEELKRIAISILADGLLPDHYRVADVDSDGLWVTSGGHRFPLREMSDGYRTVAALVVDLLKQLHDSYGGLPFEVRGGTAASSARAFVGSAATSQARIAVMTLCWLTVASAE